MDENKVNLQYKTDNRSPVGKAIEVEVEGVVAGEEEVAGGGHHPMKEAPQQAKKSPDEPRQKLLQKRTPSYMQGNPRR